MAMILFSPNPVICLPALVVTIAVVWTSQRRPKVKLATINRIAATYVAAISLYAALGDCSFAYIQRGHVPVWNNPESRFLGALFFLAPPGALLSVVATISGGARWLTSVLLLISLYLLLLGVSGFASQI